VYFSTAASELSEARRGYQLHGAGDWRVIHLK
jgi:hypothetical protein